MLAEDARFFIKNSDYLFWRELMDYFGSYGKISSSKTFLLIVKVVRFSLGLEK